MTSDRVLRRFFCVCGHGYTRVGEWRLRLSLFFRGNLRKSTVTRSEMLAFVDLEFHIYRLNALCAALSDFRIKTTNYLYSLLKFKSDPIAAKIQA